MTLLKPFVHRHGLRRYFLAVAFLVVFLSMFGHATAAGMQSTRYVGTVVTIDQKTRTITLQSNPTEKPLHLSWFWDTSFLADGKRAQPDTLKVGTRVKVKYHSPLFGREYAAEIEWSATKDHPSP